MAAGSTSGIKAGRAFIELGTADKYTAGLKRASRRLKAFGAGVRQIGQQMATMGSAIVGPLILAAKHFSNFGDQVAKMSKRTGVSVEVLSELQFVASQTGTEFATLENAFRRMQRSIFDASRGLLTQKEAFEELGLTYKDMKDLSPEAQFKLISDRLGKLKDDTKQAALAQMIFGRSGTNLIPMFEAGAEGISKLQKEARRLGLTMSKEDAKAAEEFTDTLDAMFKVVKMTVFAVGRELAPVLSEVAKTIQDAAIRATAWIKENRDLLVTILKVGAAIAAVGAVLIPVSILIAVVAKSIALLAGVVKLSIIAFKGLAVALTFLAAHPVVAAFVAIGLVVAAVVVAVNVLSASTAKLTTRMQELRSEGDKQREVDEQRLRRLDQLNAKQKLTADEMKESASLISKLTDEYGDLGIGIDRATGRLTGFSNAQSRANKLMKEAATMELKNEIAELTRNMRLLYADPPNTSVWRQLFSTRGGNKERFEAWSQQIKDIRDAANVAGKRLEALQVGADPGDADAAALGDRIRKDSKIAEAERRNRVELHAIQIRAIEDEEAREVAQLKHLFIERVRNARQIGAETMTIQMQFEESLRQLRKKFDDKEAEETKKRAEEIHAEQQAAGERVLDMIATESQERLSSEKSVQDEIARLRIEKEKEGLARTLALLALEEAAEIKSAEAIGAAIDGIREKFQLRRDLAERSDSVRRAQAAAGQRREEFSSVGSFNTTRLLGFQGAGSSQERAAAAAEITAKNTGDLVRASRKNRLVFTN